MAIKTDAMIAHNGAEGYTLHIDYDPDTDLFNLKAVFNDGAVKELNGNIDDETQANQIIDRTIKTLVTTATRIGSYSFREASLLETVIAPNATRLDTNAFYSCTALKNVYLPNIDKVLGSAFEKAGIESIYLPASVTTMSSSVFAFCNRLTVIDCGFSSDSPAAANAPWGAPDGVTVNYDVPAPNPPEMPILSIAPNPGLIQNIDLEPLEEIQPVEPEPLEVKKTTKKRSAK